MQNSQTRAASRRDGIWQCRASYLFMSDVDNLHPEKIKTDYMLVAEYDPKTGWSAPEIKPYGPLNLDPASSCFQYCPNVFEGMKVCQISIEVHSLFLTHVGILRARRTTAPIQATKKYGTTFPISPPSSTTSEFPHIH